MSLIRILHYSAWCDHAKGTPEQCNRGEDVTPPATYPKPSEFVALELRRRGWRVTAIEQLCPDHRGDKGSGSYRRAAERRVTEFSEATRRFLS